MLHRGMLPASTRIAKGRKTFVSRLLRFLQVRIRFAGYPSNKSTGEIFAFTATKLKMVVNISVLATPHNPLTKYAVKAAINHRLMAEFNISPSCLSEQVNLLIEGKFETEEQKAADSHDFFTEIANKS